MRVLAVSGGGAQGALAAVALERVEATTGPLAGVFPLVGGTSIGAALAAGVAFGIPAARMRAELEASAPAIFPAGPSRDPRWEKARRLAQGMQRARYRTAPWRAVLERLLGGACMGDASIDLAIPALDMTAGGKVVVFRRRPLSEGDPGSDVSVVEAILASSAAPTLFAPHRYRGRVYADGGMAANAPDALLWAEASRRAPGARVAMLSVGTALAHADLRAEGDLDWGVAQWMRHGRLQGLGLAAGQNGPLEVVRTALGTDHCRLDAVPRPHERAWVGLDAATPEALGVLRALQGRMDWDGFDRWWSVHGGRAPSVAPVKTYDEKA